MLFVIDSRIIQTECFMKSGYMSEVPAILFVPQRHPETDGGLYGPAGKHINKIKSHWRIKSVVSRNV